MAESADRLARAASAAGFRLAKGRWYQLAITGGCGGGFTKSRLDIYRGLIMAVAVGLAEGGTDGRCNADSGGLSCGPWQIHFGPGVTPTPGIAEIGANARAAYLKSAAGTTWRAWCTTFGDPADCGGPGPSYLKRGAAVFNTLPAAVQVVARIWPDRIAKEPATRACLVKDALDRIAADRLGRSSVGAEIANPSTLLPGGGIPGAGLLENIGTYLKIAAGGALLMAAGVLLIYVVLGRPVAEEIPAPVKAVARVAVAGPTAAVRRRRRARPRMATEPPPARAVGTPPGGGRSQTVEAAVRRRQREARIRERFEELEYERQQRGGGVRRPPAYRRSSERAPRVQGVGGERYHRARIRANVNRQRPTLQPAGRPRVP